MTDWNKAGEHWKDLDAAKFTARVGLYTDGTRIVALVTTGTVSGLEHWDRIESDDPAVATFIAQMIAASQKGQS